MNEKHNMWISVKKLIHILCFFFSSAIMYLSEIAFQISDNRQYFLLPYIRLSDVFYSDNAITYQKSLLGLLIIGSIFTAVHPIMKTCFHNVLYDKNRNIRGFAEERSLVL